jgi:hypothetical protein
MASVDLGGRDCEVLPSSVIRRQARHQAVLPLWATVHETLAWSSEQIRLSILSRVCTGVQRLEQFSMPGRVDRTGTLKFFAPELDIEVFRDRFVQKEIGVIGLLSRWFCLKIVLTCHRLQRRVRLPR